MTTETYTRIAHDWDDYYQWSDSERIAYFESLEEAAEDVEKLGDWKGAQFLRDLANKAARSRKYQPIWSPAQQRWLDSLFKKVQMSTPEGRELARKMQEERKRIDEEVKRRQEEIKRQLKLEKDLRPQIEPALEEAMQAIKKTASLLRAHGFEPSSDEPEGAHSLRGLHGEGRTGGILFEKHENPLDWKLSIIAHVYVGKEKIEFEVGGYGSIHSPIGYRGLRGGTIHSFGRGSDYLRPRMRPVTRNLASDLADVISDILNEGEEAEAKITKDLLKEDRLMLGWLEEDGLMTPDFERVKQRVERGIPMTREEREALHTARKKTAAARVASRHLLKIAFEYSEKPKTKKTRIEKLLRAIGIKSKAEDIADKIVVKKGDPDEIERLNRQKGWELILEGTKIIGPGGTLDLATVGV